VATILQQVVTDIGQMGLGPWPGPYSRARNEHGVWRAPAARLGGGWLCPMGNELAAA